MLRTIRVYGALAKFLGKRQFKAEIASAAEAVRFLLANFPHLEAHMSEPDRYYKVCVGTYELSHEEIQHPVGDEVIKIVPVLAGAGAVGRIFAGIGLIALTILTGGFGGAAIGLFGAGTIALSTIAVGVGVSLVLGGVAQLLTPVPQVNQPGTINSAQDNSDPRKSYSFSGIQNTSRQGVPVPVVYGETLVGSVVISAGIDTVQI
jgi:predicted phage tail protein